MILFPVHYSDHLLLGEKRSDTSVLFFNCHETDISHFSINIVNTILRQVVQSSLIDNHFLVGLCFLVMNCFVILLLEDHMII